LGRRYLHTENDVTLPAKTGATNCLSSGVGGDYLPDVEGSRGLLRIFFDFGMVNLTSYLSETYENDGETSSLRNFRVEFPLHLLVDKYPGNDLGYVANKSNRLHQRFTAMKLWLQGMP
jgi:hypothetical protein